MAYIVYKDNTSHYVFAKQEGTPSAINPNRILENQPSYVISSIKEQVRVASSINLDLTQSYTSIDGVSLKNGDRVLLVAQSRAAENGIYFWDSGHQRLFRSQDSFELKAGLLLMVEEGLSAGDSLWFLSTNNPITVDTTPLNFIQVSGGNHALTHISGSVDQIDGDRLDIDYSPSTYIPDSTGSLVTGDDQLTAHLAGIDNAIASSITGLDGVLALGNTTGGTNISISSGDSITAPSNEDVLVSTPNVSSGDGGDILLDPGTSSSGLDGIVKVDGDLEIYSLLLNFTSTPTTAASKGGVFVSDGSGGLDSGDLYYRPESDGTPMKLNILSPRALVLSSGAVVSGSDSQITLPPQPFAPETGATVTFTVVLSVNDPLRTATVRLYNLTDLEFITSSTLTTNSVTPIKLTTTITVGSGAGEMDSTEKLYEVWLYNDGSSIRELSFLGVASLTNT